jgi:preprotein translocase subunit SecA
VQDSVLLTSACSGHNRQPGSRPLQRIARWFRSVIGDPVDTDLVPYRETLAKIRSYDFTKLADAELQARLGSLRSHVRGAFFDCSGASREMRRFPKAIETEAFALVREAARRAVRLDAFDVQMIAGLAMSRGRIAELPTGEGKTLAAVFPASLHALGGRGVHVLTFNDYLARRDASWMGPIYRLMGLSVGCVQQGMSPSEKRAAYACDVTYATAKEAGFDFLRDRLAYEIEDLVHRPFHLAIVDEADSILIDEARIPLVISGLEDQTAWDPQRVAALARTFEIGREFETDDERRNVFLLDAGIERVESAFRCGSLYESANQRLLEALHCALRAQALLHRDVDYIVRRGRIEIIDEFTGRVVDRRHWPDGLQAAVEAKEGIASRSQGRILGSITLQHFFSHYPVLAGMTATASSAAGELSEFYGLETLIVPPHTPSRRIDHDDAVFTHKEAKQAALVREIREVHESGRPILVGTSSVRESEALAAGLEADGISCVVLNARNDEREASIIADAGLPGAVTISTNMAGRGTDIRLGGADERERERVVALGGLYVVGTNRHESLRIDRQLRGRAGRQGDPGATRFFISLEDDLFERYGLTEMLMRRYGVSRQTAALDHDVLRREIAHAQRVVEGRCFDIRRMLAKYSSLVELQRKIVHEQRDAILRDETSVRSSAVGVDSILEKHDPELYRSGVTRLGDARMTDVERRVALHHIDRAWSEHLAWVQDTRDSIHLVSLGGMTPIQEFRKVVTDAFLEMQRQIDRAVVDEMRSLLENDASIDQVLARLRGPSSTWTYLVNDDQFGWGIGLMQTANLGAAAGAALYVGPLLVLKLHLDRRRRRREKMFETR